MLLVSLFAFCERKYGYFCISVLDKIIESRDRKCRICKRFILQELSNDNFGIAHILRKQLLTLTLKLTYFNICRMVFGFEIRNFILFSGSLIYIKVTLRRALPKLLFSWTLSWIFICDKMKERIFDTCFH